jgi:hypothetical protein
MLAGRNDVAFPAQFVKRMAEYSDDGETLFGAYGYRWRQHFGYDQLDWIVDELHHNPQSRRCVLAMWNGMDTTQDSDVFIPGLRGARDTDYISADLYVATHGGKDVPCNTHAYFQMREGRLNLTVCNRSNDMLWGALGANAVHFSMLLMYVADRIGAPVGTYYQFSNNMHLYPANCGGHQVDSYLNAVREESFTAMCVTRGMSEHAKDRMPVFGTTGGPTPNRSTWDAALDMFFSIIDGEGPVSPGALVFPHEFFQQTVWPMFLAHVAYKRDEIGRALAYACSVKHPLWMAAAQEWLVRRSPAVIDVRKRGATEAK